MKNTILRLWHVGLLGGAAVLLVLSIFTALWAGWRTYQRVVGVNQSYSVMETTSAAASLIKDAELDQRAFLLSGDAIYRKSYQDSEAAVRGKLDDLGRLVEGSPRQADRNRQLKELVENRLTALRTSMQATVRREEAPTSDSGLRRMAEIDALVRVIHAEEMAFLNRRREEMRRELLTTALMIVLSSGMALALGVNAFSFMRRALTALKREAALLRAKEQAEQADREKSEFLANMSHEIRTPMNAVLGFAELLRGIVTTPKQKQYVAAINTGGKTLLSLINDILDLSKIEAGKLDLTYKPMSLRGIFDGIAVIFEQQAAERGVRLEFEVDPAVPPSLMFDGVRLRQILFNVVGNALKFTSQGSVRVTAWSRLTHEDETTVTLYLSVADTGIGIAAEHHEMIFEPFRQVGLADSGAPGGGTGLGLSITRRLTHLLHGKVWLDSAVGRGATFHFEFERVAISAALPDEDRLAPPEEDLERLRPSLILIVDDVPLNRELMQGYFEGTRHRLIHASNGQEAVAMAKKFRPDIILMDMRMPDLDGHAVREQIRANPDLQSIPMIAVTASSLLAEELNLRNVFEGYLRKPFSRLLLYSELARLLPPDAPVHRMPSTPPMLVGVRPSDPAKWRELAVRLRTLESESWPVLSRSMGVRETEAFARALVGEADAAECTPLRDYARQLLSEVQSIDIRAQEKTMRGFPAVVDAIEQATKEVSV